MNPVVALVVVVGIVAVATVVGVFWRARNGRVRAVAAQADGVPVLTAADFNTAEVFGDSATLVQFSTEYCAPCKPTRRVLADLAAKREGVTHIDIDLTDQPDLAKRFNVLQTPTVLLLDGTGAIRARIGGAPRPDDMRTHLDTILGSPHVAAS